MESCFGIGIITFNRLSILERCINEIYRYTKLPCFLVIADDGSSDQTVTWAQGQGFPVISGPRRGCAWNKNRALYFLQTFTPCDPILLFEDDTWPIGEGWERVWTSAAFRWGQVNYCYGFDPYNLPKGNGTAEDPYQCAAFGGHCTITTRKALSEVGFLNTLFRGYGWEHVEWSHRYRLRYKEAWGLPDNMLPCLDYGVRATWPASFFDQEELDYNDKVYAAIRAEPAQLGYCPPWQDEFERQQLQVETTSAWERFEAKYSGSMTTNDLARKQRQLAAHFL